MTKRMETEAQRTARMEKALEVKRIANAFEDILEHDADSRTVDFSLTTITLRLEDAQKLLALLQKA